MKIYSVQYMDENNNQVGTSVLTASSAWAKELKKYWEKEIEESKSNLKVSIWTYEVKTQGKNYGLYAFAQLFKE